MKPNWVTATTAEKWAAMSLGERALHAAASCVGIRETGRNRGQQIDKWNRAAGAPLGSAWCASFVTGMATAAGCRRLPKFPARVRSWADPAFGLDRHSEPKRERLFYWLNPNKTGHIGFVTRVLPFGFFATIEGNTDDAGSREGDGVRRRVRSVKALKRHDDWGFLDLS